MLLTPKSVNETLNTKVQCYWVTPSQPRSCGLEDGEDGEDGEDEKQKVKVGNKR